jgi:hypothetical protein
MMSWFKFFKQSDEKSAVKGLSADAATITLASTSANLVIQELTKKFAQEIKEKADEIDRTIK